MMVEDLDDLGLLDPKTLCARSAWSTSSTRRRGGRHEVRARDEADGAALRSTTTAAP